MCTVAPSYGGYDTRNIPNLVCFLDTVNRSMITLRQHSCIRRYNVTAVCQGKGNYVTSVILKINIDFWQKLK